MSDILVKQLSPETEGGYTFDVTVTEDDSRTSHRVSVSEDYCAKIGKGATSPQELVEASFHFLLEREPKESILRSFDLPEISRYFPQYESEIENYLRT